MDTSVTVLVFTHVQCGLGDVASAAKIINLLVDRHFNVDIYWILDCKDDKLQYGINMLSKDAISQVKNVRTWYSPNPNPNLSIDLVIQTPCLLGWTLEYIGCKIDIPLEDCRVLRIAEAGTPLYDPIAPKSEPYITLGLSPAHGVLITPPPAFDLLSMDDTVLAKDLYNILEEAPTPVSLNFGYAHHPESRYDFMDCIICHERDARTVIVIMNQQGEFVDQTAEVLLTEWMQNVQRMILLSDMHINTVHIIDGQQKLTRLVDAPEENSARTLYILVKRHFSHNDMRMLQAHAERILATGNHSTFEAWSSDKCQLYLYEDVKNGGFTSRFLRQQVNSLHSFSSSLAKLLALFGRDKRLKLKYGKCLIDTPHIWQQVYHILQSNSLSSETQQWFSYIRQHEHFSIAFDQHIAPLLDTGANI